MMLNIRQLNGAAFFGRAFDSSTIREDLLSQNGPRQISALQQVIAFMTIGRDMSGLFNDIVPLCSSTVLLIKRLVYLYLMHNGRIQPEKSVLQAGTFVKDTLNDSPLIRGVALRTMTSLLVPVMVDFITAPLQRCLADSDPYVRRIAAFSTLKLYYVAPNVCEETGLLIKLKDQINDTNPYVVASAVAAITELRQRHAPTFLETAILENIPKLLSAAQEVTGWYQYYLIEGIASLVVRDNAALFSQEEGIKLIERVVPFLAVLNMATVMSTVKIITSFLVRSSPSCSSSECDEPLSPLQEMYGPRLVCACVSLLYIPCFESRYATLRNIHLLLMTPLKRYFRKHVSVFLVRFDDPIYIKLEKAELLLELADINLGEMILFEFATYATSEDEEFVRKALRSIGFLAAKIESLAPKCAEQLIRLIDTGVECVVQDAAVVIQTLLRRYPNQFPDVVGKLCEAQGGLTSAESKSAIAWVIGEYAEHIEGVRTILSIFIENFSDEPLSVQLALLTTLVKIYLRSNASTIGENTETLQRVLTAATHSLLPDVRDRAFMYWRLITSDREAAKRLILVSTRSTSFVGVNSMEHHRLCALLREMGELTSVIHRPIHLIFNKSADFRENDDDDDDDDDDEDIEGDLHASDGNEWQLNALPIDDVRHTVTEAEPLSSVTALPNSLGIARGGDMICVLSADEGNGLEVHMGWTHLGSKLVLACRFLLLPGEEYVQNLRVLAIQINRNAFALGIAQECPVIQLVRGQKAPDTVNLLMGTNNKKASTRQLLIGIQADPIGTRYFLAPPIPPPLLLLPATRCDASVFAEEYRKLQAPAWEIPPDRIPFRTDSTRWTANVLRLHGLNLVYTKEMTEAGFTGTLLSAETIAGQKLFMEATVQGENLIYFALRCKDTFLAPVFGEYIMRVFAAQ